MNSKVQKLSVSLDEENVRYVDEVLCPMHGLKKRSTVLNKIITDYRRMLEAQRQLQVAQQAAQQGNPMAAAMGGFGMPTMMPAPLPTAVPQVS